jgi:hypothetical protein
VTIKSVRWAIVALIVRIAVCGGAAAGEALPTPSAKPILVVSGNITQANAGGEVHFDRDMLEALGTVTFETTTPWDKEPVRFEGVPRGRLLDRVGASGSRLIAVALNDYSAELPVEDVRRYDVILALRRNGDYMPVHNRGPLFIVYNFDSDPELKSPKFYSRSVWQVARLEVR